MIFTINTYLNKFIPKVIDLNYQCLRCLVVVLSKAPRIKQHCDIIKNLVLIIEQKL